MFRKFLLLLLALSVVLTLASCDRGEGFSTDNVKKFVQDSKSNGKMSYEKTKKAYKSIFPKMKMD